MVRGGSWAGGPLKADCAMRIVAFPTLASTNVGFRVARREINGAEGRASSDAGAGN
jgi:formylglycine-generating enzyme required for sulfatase activity